jgi:hypothetical protein
LRSAQAIVTETISKPKVVWWHTLVIPVSQADIGGLRSEVSPSTSARHNLKNKQEAKVLGL